MAAAKSHRRVLHRSGKRVDDANKKGEVIRASPTCPEMDHAKSSRKISTRRSRVLEHLDSPSVRRRKETGHSRSSLRVSGRKRSKDTQIATDGLTCESSASSAKSRQPHTERAVDANCANGLSRTSRKDKDSGTIDTIGIHCQKESNGEQLKTPRTYYRKLRNDRNKRLCQYDEDKDGVHGKSDDDELADNKRMKIEELQQAKTVLNVGEVMDKEEIMEQADECNKNYQDATKIGGLRQMSKKNIKGVHDTTASAYQEESKAETFRIASTYYGRVRNNQMNKLGQNDEDKDAVHVKGNVVNPGNKRVKREELQAVLNSGQDVDKRKMIGKVDGQKLYEVVTGRGGLRQMPEKYRKCDDDTNGIVYQESNAEPFRIHNTYYRRVRNNQMKRLGQYDEDKDAVYVKGNVDKAGNKGVKREELQAVLNSGQDVDNEEMMGKVDDGQKLYEDATGRGDLRQVTEKYSKDDGILLDSAGIGCVVKDMEDHTENFYDASLGPVDHELNTENFQNSALSLSDCKSQESDDMYHGQIRHSETTPCNCLPLKGYVKDDIDTDIPCNTGCLSHSDKSSLGYAAQTLLHDADSQILSSSRELYAVPDSPMEFFMGLKNALKALKEIPGTAKGLFSSGVLEGCRVSYKHKGEVMLTGEVKEWGILCNCQSCRGRTIVPVSIFEKHAGSNARHPSDNIFLENGQSLQDIVKGGRRSTQQKHIVRDDGNHIPEMRGVGGDGNELVDSLSLRNANGNILASSKKVKGLVGSDNGYERTSELNTQRIAQPSHARDNNRHKMLFLPGGLPDGAEVGYYTKGQRLLSGIKEGFGIRCECCNEVISCSSFESHAGWGSRRNPYTHIYLADGQSLHEYSLALIFKGCGERATKRVKDNDDICGECGDGGDLVLCDGCPRAYHTECVGLSSIPGGDWFCSSCQEKIEHDKKEFDRTSFRGNGKFSSPFSGGKSSDHCQRVVKASKNAIGGCVICKNGDFLKSGFGAKTVMLCDQCEREYHVGCMKEMGIADLQELPLGEWFCCADCERIHHVLESLVLRGPEPVCDNICNSFLKQRPCDAKFTWQLLHGRRNDPQNGRILSEAATIFTESFDPIVDAASGRNLIPPMIYSRSLRDQDFQGMYCAVLKQNDVVVSASTIRVFGRQIAEMPLVATQNAYRGQGFFQMLMANIETLLGELQVKNLVLPAAEGAEGIWINKFGFSKLHSEQVQQFGTEVPIMIFQGSCMLRKVIS